jgi:uncharacterized coiled-coil protein SlyX
MPDAMPDATPPEDPASPPLTEHKLVALEEKLTFQQRTYEELNAVVLTQQIELDKMRREVERLRTLVQSLHDRGLGEDLPHEKPPHY